MGLKELILIGLVLPAIVGLFLLFMEYRSGLFHPASSERDRSIFKRLRRAFSRSFNWLWEQRRYILLVVLLICLELILYGLGEWKLVVFSFVHLVLVMPAILLLFALKRPWTTSGLIRKIDFDYLQKLRRGREEDFLSHWDPTYGYVLRIQAERDFCMDYDLANNELKQACKAVKFLFKPESEEFPFYAIIKVRGQQPPVEIRLRCKPTEGICPAPERDQRYLYSNGDIPEYGVHVPMHRLNDGWALMSIDLLEQVRDIATLEGREWELDGLVTLRLKGEGIRGDVAYIWLYSESVE